MKRSMVSYLKSKAEKLLSKELTDINAAIYKDDFERLIEEFSTYQVELELQNEELNRSQVALENEKNKFTDLFLNAPTGYLQLSSEGVILSINNKMLSILNLIEPLLIGKKFVSFLDSDNVNLFNNHLSNVFNSRNNDEKVVELFIRDSNKTPKYLKLTSNIMVDRVTHIKYCRTIVEEVTEVVNTTKELKRSNERLEASIRAGNMAWWEVYLPSGKVLFNENKVLMLGRDPKDFNHYTHFTDLLHPDDYEISMQAFRDHLEGKAENYECEYRIRHKDGSYKWFYDIGRITTVTDDTTILTGIVYDITKRKVAEIEREKSDNNFKNVLDGFVDAVYITNMDNEIIYMNKALEKMIGKYELGFKCHKTIFDLDEKCSWCKCGDIFEGKKYVTYEIDIEKDDIVIAVRKQLLDNDTIITIYDDITDRKKSEIELQKSEEKYRQLYETMAQGVVYQNSKGEITSANPAAERILGLSIDQLMGRKSVDPRWKAIKESGEIYPGEEHPAMRALATGKPIYNDIMGVFDPKGDNTRWINVNANPVFKKGSKKASEVYTTFEDLTTIKEAESILLKSERKYRGIFEYSNIGIALAYQDGVIFELNPVFENMLGYTRSELLKMNFADFTYHEDVEKEFQLFGELLENRREFYRLEKRYVKKDGSLIWVDLIVTVGRMDDGGVDVFTGMATDITQRKEAELELQSKSFELGERVKELNCLNTLSDMIISNYSLLEIVTKLPELIRVSFMYPDTTTVKVQVGNMVHKLNNFKETQWKLSEKIVVDFDKEIELSVYLTEEPKGVIFLQEERNLLHNIGLLLQNYYEKLKFEKALASSENRYRKLFNSANDTIILADLESGEISDINFMGEQLLGLEKSSLIGKNIIDLHPENEKEKVFKDIAIATTSDSFISKDFHFLNSKGMEIPVEIRTTILNLGDQKYLYGVIKDLTKEKEAEKLLKDSEEKYRALVENSQMGITLTTLDGDIVTANKAAIEIYGVESSELLTKNVKSFYFDKRDRDKLISMLQKDGKVTNFEAPFYRRGRDVIYVNVNMDLITLNESQLLLTTHLDITDKIEAEKAIKESEKSLINVIENIPHGVYLTSMGGEILLANKQAELQTGYSREELISFNVSQIDRLVVSRNDKEVFWKRLETQKTVSFDTKHYRKDGSSYLAEINLGKAFYNGEFTMIAIVKDISKRKEEENKLRDALEEKEILLKEIHHRVKNNMQTIQSLLQKQQRQIGSDEVKKALGDSINRVQSMSVIHEQIYRSKNIARVNLKDYLNDISKKLITTYNIKERYQLQA